MNTTETELLVRSLVWTVLIHISQKVMVELLQMLMRKGSNQQKCGCNVCFLQVMGIS